MFIRFFKSNYFFQYFLFIILALALWSDVLINPDKIKILHQTTGAAWLDFTFEHFPLVTVILFISLLIFQALFFNQVHENYRLADRNQLLLAAFYILITCSAPILVRPHIIIIINFLMIILLNTMFSILGKNEPYRQVFDASFLVGIAALFYFPAIFFIIFIWLCFVVYQIFSWREWTISVLAFVIPFLFVGTYYFWTDQIMEVSRAYIARFVEIKPVVVAANTYTYIIWGLLSFLILLVFSRIMRGIIETTVDLRKKSRIILLFFFVVAISAVYSGQNFRSHLLLAAIPVSAIFGTHFSQSKKLILPEIITLLILIIVFTGKFMTLK